MNLRNRNRLEELRAKHGHERDWPEVISESDSAWLISMPDRVHSGVRAGSSTLGTTAGEPLPSDQKREGVAGVTTQASPDTSLMSGIEL